MSVSIIVRDTESLTQNLWNVEPARLSFVWPNTLAQRPPLSKSSPLRSPLIPLQLISRLVELGTSQLVVGSRRLDFRSAFCTPDLLGQVSTWECGRW